MILVLPLLRGLLSRELVVAGGGMLVRSSVGEVRSGEEAVEFAG